MSLAGIFIGGPPRWKFFQIPVGNEEGWISAEVCANERPREEEVMGRSPVQVSFVHEPGCRRYLRLVTVSDKAKALICDHCLLRVVFPSYVLTIGELQSHLRTHAGTAR